MPPASCSFTGEEADVNWTVGRRIGAGYAVALALVVLIGVLAVWALDRTSGSYQEALQMEREALLETFAVRGDVRNANTNFLRYLLEPDPALLQSRDSAVLAARESMTRLRNAAERPDIQALWTDAQERLAEWHAAASDASGAAARGDLATALEIRLTRAQPLRMALESIVVRGVHEAQTLTDRAVADAAGVGRASRDGLVVATLLTLILGILSALLLYRAVSRPLRETSSVLASSAAQILAATTEQAAGATESMAAVTQTAATVDQVVQTADQAADRARTVAQSAQRAAETGREGREAVEQSSAAMSRVKQQVDGIGAQIGALAEQAQAVGEIIATVNDLAEQTNLLALNAAIEAARAGEQGRGFAVVAGEVKSLAEQSKTATARVRQILGEIQRATTEAVAATQRGAAQVAESARQVDQAGEVIRALAESVAGAAQAAAQIAASAGQQSTGMGQIRQAVASIRQAAQQNLAATKQAEQAAQELNRMGGRLLLLVGGDGETAA
jgi:methyl-accepting chemotaxis protein